jgi:hypothetical protein
MTLEQTPDFVLLRRILRAVAPEYSLMTNAQLPPDNSYLDIDRKIIAVSDHTDTFTAIAAVLFQVGHIINDASAEAAADLKEFSIHLNKADRAAAKWALGAIMLYWPETEYGRAKRAVRRYIMSPFQWLNHLRQEI